MGWPRPRPGVAPSAPRAGRSSEAIGWRAGCGGEGSAAEGDCLLLRAVDGAVRPRRGGRRLENVLLLPGRPERGTALPGCSLCQHGRSLSSWAFRAWGWTAGAGAGPRLCPRRRSATRIRRCAGKWPRECRPCRWVQPQHNAMAAPPGRGGGAASTGGARARDPGPWRVGHGWAQVAGGPRGRPGPDPGTPAGRGRAAEPQAPEAACCRAQRRRPAEAPRGRRAGNACLRGPGGAVAASPSGPARLCAAGGLAGSTRAAPAGLRCSRLDEKLF